MTQVSAFGGDPLTRSAWYASVTGMASLLTEVGAGAGTATEMIWPGTTPAGIGTLTMRPSGIRTWTGMPGCESGGTWICTIS